MKKPLLILFMILSAYIAKAQDVITTLKGVAADTAIFTVVDINPKMPRDFGQYLFKCMQANSMHKTKGAMLLTFIVEKDGSLSNIKVIKKLSHIGIMKLLKF